MDDLKHTLVVENRVLRTQIGDYKSGNGFLASQRLNENRRMLRTKDSKTRTDMTWLMKILPKLAEYFGVGRKELLGWWMEDFGLDEFLTTE